jgi:hypothetical protein
MGWNGSIRQNQSLDTSIRRMFEVEEKQWKETRNENSVTSLTAFPLCSICLSTQTPGLASGFFA